MSKEMKLMSKSDTNADADAGKSDELDVLGTIKCNNSVFKEIAGYTAMQTLGIAGVGGRYAIGATLTFGEKDPGVEVITPQDDKKLKENEISITLDVEIFFGYNIYDVCSDLQHKIKNEIQNTTSYVVREVNVNVQGLKPREAVDAPGEVDNA